MTDTHFIILNAGAADAASSSLKEQYYALRSKAFDAHWGNRLYPSGPDDYDLKPDTIYLLQTAGDKVISGLRLLPHFPGSEEITSSERRHPEFQLQKLLPHLDRKNLFYAELSGIVADPSPLYRNRHLGTGLVKDLFDKVKAGAITHEGVPLNLLFSSASKTGLGPIVRAAQETSMPGIIRVDQIKTEEDPRFKTQLWPIILSPTAEFTFMPPELQDKNNVAVNIDQFHLPVKKTGFESP